MQVLCDNEVMLPDQVRDLRADEVRLPEQVRGLCADEVRLPEQVRGIRAIGDDMLPRRCRTYALARIVSSLLNSMNSYVYDNHVTFIEVINKNTHICLERLSRIEAP
jgi:hypothetical protein